MKRIGILLLQIMFIVPSLAQETVTPKKSNNNVTRQGFGTHVGFDTGIGFVNPRVATDGSAYYFEDWNTEGIVYTKKNGSFRIEKVNINLYDNNLEAIYDENSIFTFDSDNIIKIQINSKIFRPLIVDDELKIFEIVFNDTFSVYKHYSVLYSEASVNPMHNRKTNKYIKKAKYYLFQDDKLTPMKLSKKAFSKLFQSEEVTQESILKYIKKSKLSLRKEADLIKVLNFVEK